ncbi:MAG: hypothetical protein EAZ32_09080 [Cytophagia bacterium]|nr:MAG: hypothetical protein EAZ46_04990 [Runella sp.]TAG20560.1 MAG: hypothetical protein EAZ38_09960 [Cytophagales bacterium]TAG39764.1 MAG: hypothetical protein EAZ32_09080 [Cytophagia bacterium]TAG52744.1 MAG: hypothetical protein EAZ29_06855 [Runella slithyformis]TAG81360.1 MAG: hypothetical protein EAZ22_07385 [Cytophagales bacterium]
MKTSNNRPVWPFLGVGLGLVFMVRWVFQPSYELNPDSSAWISSAISAACSDTPFWTLLTHSDSRPLVVLPLFLLELLGVPVTWFVADLVGVALWLVTTVFFYLTLRRWLSNWHAFYFTTPLLFFQALHLEADFMAYNSEHICALMLTVGVWLLVRFEAAKKPLWQYILAGFWLGMFPFAKMQIVPMGVVLGLFSAFYTFKQWRYWGVFVLFAGCVLPTVFANLYYLQKDGIAAFWNDYFWNYYYYSFTKTYSELAIEQRFGLRFMVKIFYKTANLRVFWLGSAGLILVGTGAWWKTKNAKYRLISLPMYGFIALFFLTSLYAILQAGNLFLHYLLLLVVPLFLLIASLILVFPFPKIKQMGLFYLLILGLEGANNIRRYINHPPHLVPHYEVEIRDRIEKVVLPNQKMTIWGYADHFFVYSRITAGNRLSHTFWVYWPSPLRPYREHQFLTDLSQNQTEWFLDFSGSKVQFNDKKMNHVYFPKIASYIRTHYQLTETQQGVQFYRRNIANDK